MVQAWSLGLLKDLKKKEPKFNTCLGTGPVQGQTWQLTETLLKSERTDTQTERQKQANRRKI